MFTVKETARTILEILVKNTSFDPDKTVGFTTYEMQNLGIPPANWTKYKDQLLYFQLVSETYEKKSKSHKPRRGKRKRKTKEKEFKIRYYVTPIGFLTLLQNLKTNKISDYITTDYLKFLPLISKYLLDLQELGVLFYVLFKYSIENIEIKPVGTSKIKKGEKLKSIVDRQIQEKITLSFMTEQTQMSFIQNFQTLSSVEKIIVDHTLKHKRNILNYDELVNSISNHLTFLFYFYLMLLQEDKLFLHKLCLDVNPPNSKYKTIKFSEEIPIEEYKKLVEKSVRLEKEVLIKLKPLIKKIKKDHEIIKLFDSNLTEIESKLLSIDFIEYLSKSMK